MKKSYRKIVWRTIWHTLSRFLAIFSIVALGVGFLAGLLAATPDMRYSGDRYFDETKLADIRVISTLGLTDDDVAAIKAVEGIEEVMPVYSADLLMRSGSTDNLVTRVHSVPLQALSAENPEGYLNRFVLVDGRMPENASECVVEKSPIDGANVRVGDTLRADADNKNLEDTLAITEFTVVGVVQSSYYFSFERETARVGNGEMNLVAYLPSESFSMQQYTEIDATIQGAAALNSLGKQYQDVKDDMITALKAVAPARCEIRLAEVKRDANETLAEARTEYNEQKADANAQLADAEQTLADGEKEVADGKRDIENARKELQNGEAELAKQRQDFAAFVRKSQDEIDAGNAQLATAQKDLDAANAALLAAQNRLNDGEAQYTAGKAMLDAAGAQLAQLTAARVGAEAAYAASPTPENKAALDALIAQESAANAAYQQNAAILAATRAQLDAAAREIAANKAALAAAAAQLSENSAQLHSAWVQLSNGNATAQQEFNKAEQTLTDARAELAKGEKEVADAEIKLADGQKEYADKKAEANEKLAEADQKIRDAQKDIDALATPEWYVMGRESIISFSGFDANISKVEAIARVFPIFFFLVAALVALTTMTRMVEEERGQIGTLKALGYSKGSIAVKYIVYAFFASASGCVVGLLVGFQLFPRVIWNAYSMMYNLPPLTCQFNVKYAVIAASAAMLCTMLATANACWATLSETPANLMLPRAPKAGKRILLERIGFVWKRMKFTHKVTARNLFRYKKRFFMTVIGIAGCTALLLTGFGLRDSISDIINKQFGEIFTYDLIISVKDEEAAKSEALLGVLNNPADIQSSLAVHQEKATNVFDGTSTTIYLVVPEDETQLGNFIDLHERRGKAPVPLGESGVILSEKLAARAGVGVGDTITLTNNNKKTGSFTVAGIAENYVENYAYFSPGEYQRGFGEAPQFLLYYARDAAADGEGEEALATKLLTCDDINSISFVSALRKTFDDMLHNITYIVYVLIVSAGVLAFIVLYNLTNINITERQKEIATIKVLGFFDGEVAAYVYRENVVLTLIGTAVGLVLGIFLHMFVIRTAEVDVVMFGREISAYSFIISAALTLFFSAAVNLVMRGKLRRISMVESMKAPE